jgi:hypothetical protein
MKRSANPRIRPVPRSTFSISREQFTHLLEAMPEKYRGLVRSAVEARAPLSSNGLSERERISVLFAFRKARELASLPQLIFHDLTRITITGPNIDET